LNGSSTRLKFNVNWMDSKLPPEKQEGHAGGQAANFELLKKACENSPA
jgi:hypothetical protein